ncbi:MAG: N-acetylmuramic acid 6-phosphate etherase [Pseudomonadota bacterium]|nr:N-acetylmuramic acid 6-phosphate etherase [Pseudomonadota bacterium]
MRQTEETSDRYVELDTWDDEKILDALVDGQARAVESVRRARAALAAAARAIAGRLSQGGRLVYAGAGSSIRIAAQDGSELPATFGFAPERLVYLIAGGNEALLEGRATAEDDEREARAAVAAHDLGARDVLIAVSASGSTPYTLAAAKAARGRGSMIVGIANNRSAPLLEAADHPILLESGPEVIAGSTRLGAGTAQKSALGLLSTLVNIRLGAVYDGMMVNLRADNVKLKARARAMVARIAKVNERQAEQALAESHGEVAPAALLCAGAAGLAEAQELLAQCRGNLRLALARLAGS